MLESENIEDYDKTIKTHNFEEVYSSDNIDEMIKLVLSDQDCIGIVPINSDVKKEVIDKDHLGQILKGIGVRNLHNSNEIPDGYCVYK